MRAAVGETERSVGVEDHLAHVVEVAVGVPEERVHQQHPPLVPEEKVVHDVFFGATLTCSDRGDALFGCGLVVGRVSDDEHAVEAGLHDTHDRVVGVLLGEDRGPDLGLAQRGDALVERVTGLYGVKPTVEFVDVLALVDNANASV